MRNHEMDKMIIIIVPTLSLELHPGEENAANLLYNYRISPSVCGVMTTTHQILVQNICLRRN